MIMLLLLASSSIVVVLVLYSIEMIGEKLSRTIQFKHLLFVTGGIMFDTVGTSLMNGIASQDEGSSFGSPQLTGGPDGVPVTMGDLSLLQRR